MRNLLVEKVKHYKNFADDVYNVFRKVRYGIEPRSGGEEYDVTMIRKELVDWQSNGDNDALTQTSINYYGWLPVNYQSYDESVVYQSSVQDPYKYLKVMSSNPINVGLSYNYGTNQNQNLIEVNAGGCVTRINLNPAVNINAALPAQYTFHQSTAATTWTITHSLGFIPNVFIMDESGTEMIGVIDTATTTQFVISFTDPVSGYAYLS